MPWTYSPKWVKEAYYSVPIILHGFTIFCTARLFDRLPAIFVYVLGTLTFSNGISVFVNSGYDGSSSILSSDLQSPTKAPE